MLDAGYTPKKSTGLATIMVLYQGPKMDQGHEPCSFTDKALNAQKAGADAVLIASYTEQLYMAVVKETDKEYQKAQDVTATVGMIRASAAKALTDQISGGKKLLMQLDWTSVFPRTKIVEWELWDSSEDNCGAKCDMEQEFTREFAPIARTLEMGEWTHFSPHYLTWLCPEGYEGSADCVSQCIHKGRYCYPDPEEDFSTGYNGRDVVQENLRQLCLFKQAKKDNKPWLWWDYLNKFRDQCKMEDNKYDEECAERIFLHVGGGDLPGGVEQWRACFKSEDEDTTNAVLEAEQVAQIGNKKEGSSDIVILPAIRINHKHFVGQISTQNVLSGLCSAFDAEDYSEKPDLCRCTSSSDKDTFATCIKNNAHDVCKVGKVGQKTCAGNTVSGMTLCENTLEEPYFSCHCPEGFQEVKDVSGKTVCEATNQCLTKAKGVGKCSCERCACYYQPQVAELMCKGPIPSPCDQPDNGGCWKATIDGKDYSACVDRIAAYKEQTSSGSLGPQSSFEMSTCRCPAGFKDDENGGCRQSCKAGTVYNADSGKCLEEAGHAAEEREVIEKRAASRGGGSIAAGILGGLLLLGVAAFVVYRYKMRSYMDQEIRSIMSQYMPLDKEPGM